MPLSPLSIKRSPAAVLIRWRRHNAFNLGNKTCDLQPEWIVVTKHHVSICAMVAKM